MIVATRWRFVVVMAHVQDRWGGYTAGVSDLIHRCEPRPTWRQLFWVIVGKVFEFCKRNVCINNSFTFPGCFVWTYWILKTMFIQENIHVETDLNFYSISCYRGEFFCFGFRIVISSKDGNPSHTCRHTHTHTHTYIHTHRQKPSVLG